MVNISHPSMKIIQCFIQYILNCTYFAATMAISTKHILFITPAFPESENNSHAVIYFANFIKAYTQVNPQHKISIISLQLPTERKNYQYYDATVYAMGTYGQAKWKKIKTWFEVNKLAKQIHEKNKVSIVHALWLKECAFISNRVAKNLGVKAICTIMGMELQRKNQFLRFLNLKKMNLVFVSPRHYDLHQEQIPKTNKINIIPWGIDQATLFSDLNKKKKYDILFVGFLNDNKNLKLFVQIIENLKKEKPEIKAVVIGDFFNLEEWKKKVKSMNLENQIEFKGILPNNQVLEIMRETKILLHTSHYESLGYVMLEALSQGTFVVSKAVGIAEASDRWFICEEEKDFTSTISDLLRNYKPQIGTAPHSLQNTVKSYSSLYIKHSE